MDWSSWDAPQALRKFKDLCQLYFSGPLKEKSKESGADPHLAMLCLRGTPLDHNITSPTELLNSRVYQANLPSISKPGLSLSADGEVNTKLHARQDEQKSQYDKSSKPLPAIFPGDPVHVLNPHDHKWESGIVKGNTKGPSLIHGHHDKWKYPQANPQSYSTNRREHLYPKHPQWWSTSILIWSLKHHAQHLTWQLWTDRAGLWCICQYTTVEVSNSRSPSLQILKTCQAPWEIGLIDWTEKQTWYRIYGELGKKSESQIGFEPTTLRDLDSMVSKGQFVGLDWNRITRLHSQVMTGTRELTNGIIVVLITKSRSRSLVNMWSSCSITFLFPYSLVYFCEFIAPLRRRGMS